MKQHFGESHAKNKQKGPICIDLIVMLDTYSTIKIQSLSEGFFIFKFHITKT